VLSQVKLIAEPWDLGEGGYQVGNFPVLWAEWNGIYRDVVRRFWRGDAGLIDNLAYRLTGSSDLYEGGGRRPYASINFVTSHDGFTLADLTSYNEKHNEANGEDNRDGENHNLSWNCGVEGPADDPQVLMMRARQRRNFLATLLLSQGVPMLQAGDEIARTQRGNNNAYCQDNELSWIDWNLDDEKRELLEFTRLLIRLFHQHPVLRRRKFFQGRKIRGSEIKDLSWFRPDGEEMAEEDWANEALRFLGVRLAGDAIDEVDERGNRITGDTLLILLNAYHETISFVLPTHRPDLRWKLLLDTKEPTGRQERRQDLQSDGTYNLEPYSLALFRLQSDEETRHSGESEPPPKRARDERLSSKPRQGRTSRQKDERRN
jgi:isoamylase